MPDIGLTNQIINNLIYYFNDKLLDSGYYENILFDESDFATNDIATLIPVDDDVYPASGNFYQVWKSPFSNWVYESGIIPPSGMDEPIVASGIYVGGIFKDKTDASFEHIVDYKNGRIIFTSGQDQSLDIKGQFAYKLVNIKIPNKRDQIFLDRILFTNPDLDTAQLLPSGFQETLPLILIDHDEDRLSPAQLGGSHNVNVRLLCHILANDKPSKNNIKDAILRLERQVPLMIDFNEATHPLDFNGDFASGQYPFSFKEKQADSSILYRKLYLDSMKGRNIRSGLGLEQAVIDIDALVFKPGF